MKISKELLYPYLLYNLPVNYNGIILHPVTMKNIIDFRSLSSSIMIRKNSVFRDKKIIKMSYLDFLWYAFKNEELQAEYRIPFLTEYYIRALKLLQLCCKDCVFNIDRYTGEFSINDVEITPEIFDDLRRIIIIQNDIDFDIDEFINFDTEQRLLKAQRDINKNEEHTSIEDYIDSLVIAMHTTEDIVMNMTIRKFWRYIKRYNLHESYTIAKTGECSGMVTFKEPIKHWMRSLEDDDKYKDLKTDEQSLKDKISG